MAIDRRKLLLGTLAFIGARPAWGTASTGAETASYVSAVRNRDETYAVLLLSQSGAILRSIPLSARGHDIALDPRHGRAVTFARRPGTFAVAFETLKASEPIVITASPGRHFYGHGRFSIDGRLLYVSENDIADKRGVVGIYDVEAGYKRIGEHSSFGLGPHEIILLGDGKTLAIANGGLDTVPEAGRENLNLDQMDPSLVFIDAERGTLLAKHRLGPECAKLSLRHLATDYRGTVWFGGQWEGTVADAPPLAGSVSIDSAPALISCDPAAMQPLKGYIGSVAANRDGRLIAVTAPKGGRVLYIEAATGKIAGETKLNDACGAAADDEADFMLTSGFGVMRQENASGSVISTSELAGVAFDNHVRRLRAS